MKAVILCTFLAVSLLAFQSSFGQPVFVHGTTTTTMKIHPGFVVVNNLDTLYGNIKLNQHQKQQSGLNIWSKDEKKFIASQDINYVRLFDYDSTIISTPYTEFKKLTSKPILWRHIASGKIDIYDNLLFANEKKGDIGEGLLVVDKNIVTNITRPFSFFVSDDLLRYTNKKHGTHYKAKDFPSVKAMLKFIADNG